MNLPNRLTISRMIMAPIFMWVILAEYIPQRFLWATILFSIASITDAIDGEIARKQKLITNFGKFLDPLADKMLTTAALLAFMQLGLCNIWIVMIILAREFAVTSVRLVASAKGIVVPANFWGKLKTASQMAFTILILLLKTLMELSVISQSFNISLVSNILLWITAVLTIISGVTYLIESRRFIEP